MEERDSLTFSYQGKIVKYQLLEKSNAYQTLVIFVEMDGVEHIGFSMKRGDKYITKGQIAKAVRDEKIDGVEMAVAPPSDSNAVIMVRITKPFDELKDKILDIVFRELKNNGFI